MSAEIPMTSEDMERQYSQRRDFGSVPVEKIYGRVGKEGEDIPLRIILIEKTTEDRELKILPIIVNETAPEDSLSHFIILETDRIRERLKDLRNRRHTIGQSTTHHRQRRVRVAREARESLTNEIDREEEKLGVLEGQVLQPVRPIKKEREIIGFELRSFRSREEKEFWRFASGSLLEIAEIAKKFPEAVELLIEGYTYRWKMRYGDTGEEIDSAKSQYQDFLARLKEVEEEKIKMVVPILRMVTQALGS